MRFSPDETALACLDAESDADKWCVLESGTVDYLKVVPSSEAGASGNFEWVSDKSEANPELYAASEGAHVEDGILTFTSTLEGYLWRLDLAAGTYTRSACPFASESDNLRILGGVVYLCTGKKLSLFPYCLRRDISCPSSWHLMLLPCLLYLFIRLAIADDDDNPGDAVWRWDDKGASRMFYEVKENNYCARIQCCLVISNATHLTLCVLLWPITLFRLVTAILQELTSRLIKRSCM